MSPNFPKTRPTLVILAGGQGTRLRSVDAINPKPMVPVLGRPFLSWAIEHYAAQGFTQFLVSTGYKAELFEKHPWKKEFPNLAIRFIAEPSPLGTGGATQEVFRSQNLAHAWVVNGDTLLESRLPEVDSKCEAMFTTMRADQIFDASPNLSCQENQITGTGKTGATLFDAGCTWVTRAALDRFQGSTPVSLHEVLAPSIAAGKVTHRTVPGACYDIGTPERFRRFESALKQKALFQ